MEAASSGSGKRAHQVSYKVLLLGDSGVGKTSISWAIRGEAFLPALITTVGIDFVTQYFDVDGCCVKLQVWDTAGQERFRTITKFHYRGSKGLVLIFDITDQESFDHIIYWYNTLEERDLDAEQVFLVGNKCDLESQRQVPKRKAQQFATNHNLKYFETSCKSNTNVTEMFQQLALDILETNNPQLMSAYNKSIAQHYRERTESGKDSAHSNNNGMPGAAQNGASSFKLTKHRDGDRQQRWPACCGSVT